MGQEWMRPEDFHDNRDQLETDLDLVLVKCTNDFITLKREDFLKFPETTAHHDLLDQLFTLTDELDGFRSDVGEAREKLFGIMASDNEKLQASYAGIRSALHISTAKCAETLNHLIAISKKLGDVYKQTARTNGDLNGSWAIFNADLERAAEHMVKIVEADKNDVAF